MGREYDANEVMEELRRHEAGCDRRQEKIEARFDKLDDKFDRIPRTIYYTVGIVGAFLGILITLMGFFVALQTNNSVQAYYPYPPFPHHQAWQPAPSNSIRGQVALPNTDQKPKNVSIQPAASSE
ncbi:MAG: hypothetical protein OXE98_03510 [Hyphomicrobiales bacterium]|nr:hypothetical protein [Hyphomicrobiales bacterium]MCY4052928.1 hypothetical protein [Hyphomicrobiales bacterium]